jgi:YVTN family beta-propeller protein
VYVTNQGAGTLAVINPKTLKVVATTTVGTSPFGVAVSP